MEKILITGGAGFIGSNFIRYMLNRYPAYEIINMDSLTYAGKLENLADVQANPRYRFIRADITDAQAVEEIMGSGVDAVINFAAESHVDRSIAAPELFVSTNVLGTQVLLTAAVKYGIGRYVQISTDEVYGSLPDGGLFSEESPLAANSPYSASKAGADLLVRACHQTYGLRVNITRCSNNYGPSQLPEKLIPLAITSALDNRPIPVYGDGLQVRDWLHVADHCSAIDLVLHHGDSGEVFNIGANQELTNLQIIEAILAELGKPRSLVRHVDDRPGHDRRYAIDAAKIRTRLGWRPQYSFADGLRETVRWYCERYARN